MWKQNWEATQERFRKWWNREGVMIGMWGAPQTTTCLHADVPQPTVPESLTDRWCDAGYRANANHARLARSTFPEDVLPLADTDLGPGSLALLLGSEPEFSEDTVWFHPGVQPGQNPEALPSLKFDPSTPWWKKTEEIITKCVAQAAGDYLVGCPDLVENLDTLASLCTPETVCMSLIERPDWVLQKIEEINEVWFEAYDRIYELIKQPDGSAAFGAFYLWAPGKVAKVQCDCSAMISPTMFRQFVVPSLKKQCERLDYSLYHLDGTQAMRHLDALLEIEPLDAIEWTPQAGIEPGGHPRWYELYQKILAAGKSVQVVNVEQNEIDPLLDAVGNEGVYILTKTTAATNGTAG